MNEKKDAGPESTRVLNCLVLSGWANKQIERQTETKKQHVHIYE